ncbi:hypothetical protein AAFF_G00246880 [Aldrovandia affinis]|uniref:Uncharacterized protein n=1 Tax=Aldrovandia affinis TaxID=143900 RepID=A0AAD7WTX4_9TELE|nr:hypothetical protein AAFF_G00246880 [Aldrovandia affinis]
MKAPLHLQLGRFFELLFSVTYTSRLQCGLTSVNERAPPLLQFSWRSEEGEGFVNPHILILQNLERFDGIPC